MMSTSEPRSWQLPTPIRELLHRRITRTLAKFAAGSVMATVVSEVVLLSALGTHLTGPKVAAVCAWAAGAIFNYTVSRRWAWGLRGRSDLLREVLPYWTMSIVALVASTITTDLSHRYAATLFGGHALQTAFVGFVYLGTYGVLFIVKFCLYHFVLWGNRSQQPATTR